MAEGGGHPAARYQGAGTSLEDMDMEDADEMKKMQHGGMMSSMPSNNEPSGDNADDGSNKTKKIEDLNWATVAEIASLNKFNSDTIGHLESLSESVYNHQEVSHHIQQYIEQEVQMEPDSYETTDRNQLKEDLSFLAFTEAVAEKIVQQIPDSILRSQNASYWGVNHLSNWIFCKQVGQFMFMSNVVDIPFIHQFKVSFNHKYPNSERKISVYNEENKAPMSNFSAGHDVSTQYYFHGTDWDSVESIMKHGILLRGRVFGQDFSFRQRPGFYVSDNVDSGKDWAVAKAMCPAVVVFRVPNSLFGNPSQHLDLTNKDTQFQREVYAYHRSEGDERIRQETVAQIESSKTIRGPQLLNPAALRLKKGTEDDGDDSNRDRAQQPLELSRNLQVCVLDEEVASALYDSIEGVIYYKNRQMMSPDAGGGW